MKENNTEYKSSIPDESLAEMAKTVEGRGVLGLKWTFTCYMEDNTGAHDLNFESYLRSFFRLENPAALEPDHQMYTKMSEHFLSNPEIIRSFFEWASMKKLEDQLYNSDIPPYC